jgi:hypothetical protein
MSVKAGQAHGDTGEYLFGGLFWRLQRLENPLFNEFILPTLPPPVRVGAPRVSAAMVMESSALRQLMHTLTALAGRSWPGLVQERCSEAESLERRRTLRPWPRKAAGVSPSSTIKMSMTVRSPLPGTPGVRGPLAIGRPRLGRASRLNRPPGGNGWQASSSGSDIPSSPTSFVKIANNDLRRGSLTCSESSIRSRIRCWQAGRLITQLRSSAAFVGCAVVLAGPARDAAVLLRHGRRLRCCLG